MATKLKVKTSLFFKILLVLQIHKFGRTFPSMFKMYGNLVQLF